MLRKTLLITLLIVLLTACAPQATPTVAPVATEIVATQAPAAQSHTLEPPAKLLPPKRRPLYQQPHRQALP